MAGAIPPSPLGPDVVLVTLDTTRADALGSYGGPATPTLDRLAARGIRYERAISPSPLTLPAHASLLTGLTPPEHGLHDNGLAALGTSMPTLATQLADAGWETAAIVGSRVLDRRFGLDRGFQHYDDRMAAEYRGEYGYPERSAAAVTDAALQWLESRSARPSPPLFLWVHYYDPHAPYTPADGSRGNDTARYHAEILEVDRQLGRLLALLPDRPRVTAVVADHGEALGAHGERTHGLLLHEPTLRVPLLLQGARVPQGRTVDHLVGSRHLAATLLELVGLDSGPFGAPLPGLGFEAEGSPAAPSSTAVYSETHLPYTAYGWSVLESLTEAQLRFVVGSRAELFDLSTDPEEHDDLVDERRRTVRRLQAAWRDRHRAFEPRAVSGAASDPETTAALRALGYLSGTSGRTPGRPDPKRLDPKAGLALLEEMEEAKRLLSRGEVAEAEKRLAQLVARNPENVPLLSNLARAQIALASIRGSDPEPGLATYRRALELNPHLDFLHLGLGRALLQMGRLTEAEEALRATLTLDPRSADAWLGLAELAGRRGEADHERALLEEAVAAGTESSAILLRLAQLRQALGTEQSTHNAGEALRRASELTPDWPLVWLHRGRWELDHGDPAAGRQALSRVLQLAPQSAWADRARRWLAALPSPPP